MKPLKTFEFYKGLYERRAAALKAAKGYRTKLYNWSRVVDQDLWLPRFIERTGIFANSSRCRKAAIYTVFGPRWAMKFDRADIRLFLARENVHREQLSHYADLCLEDPEIDLSIGFDYLEHPAYIRVPLWVMWTFDPADTYYTIQQKLARWDALENHSYAGEAPGKQKKFCAFLCSHDDIGRRQIYDTFDAIGKVDCDGRLFHNNDELKTKFADDKVAYLSQYRFNLCPENSNHAGYCTEKLFEAIQAGCVPIYSGSDNRPEPDVLNPQAICFFEDYRSLEPCAEQVRMLEADEKRYLAFARQPRFMPHAAEAIWAYFELLDRKIRCLAANL